MYEYSKAAQDGDTTLWGWNRVFGEGGSQMLLIDYENDENVKLVLRSCNRDHEYEKNNVGHRARRSVH